MADSFSYEDATSSAFTYEDAGGIAPKTGGFRKLADIGASFAGGAVGATKAIVDAGGAGSTVSQRLDGAQDTVQGWLSPARQAEKAARAQIISEAEKSGSTLREVGAHLGAFAEAPVSTVAEAAGSVVPVVGAMLTPAGRSATARTLLGLGLGAAQGAGSVKGSIYDAVQQKHIEQGATPEVARQTAEQAQAYTGPNTGSIAVGAGVGAVAGTSGVESVVSRAIAGKAAAGGASMVRRAAVGAVAEGLPEALQGGQERLATNQALQQQGFNVPTWQGVAGQAAAEGLAGGVLGGGVNAASRGHARLDAAPAPPINADDPSVGADAAAPDAPPLALGNTPDPLISFPDGSVGRQSEFDRYINGLPEEQRIAERAKLMGYGAQPADASSPAPDAPPSTPPETQQLGYSPLAGTPTVFPDGSVALGSEAEFAHRYAPQPVKPSQAMGIDPTAGPLSKSAALAVDSGAYMPPAGQAPAPVPEPDPVVLQNRDRTSAASIAQMQEIAANPDYLRVGPSRDMTSGAPIVFGELPPTALLGRPETVVDGHGERMGTQYAVVDAGDLIASNNADGTAVADYASGAPGKLRSVAGNGRTAGLQAAYQLGTAQRYRQELAGDAASLGVDAQALGAMQRPVLVRVMQGADVTRDMGDRTNITATQKLSPLEQAGNDARRLDVRTLSFDEGGNPTADSIKGFVSAMPVAERGDMLNADGTPTRQAVDRLMAATFKQAYESDELVQLYAQASDPDARAVMAAAADASGVLANLKGAGEFDVRAAVADAAKMAVNAARQGLKLSDVLQNQDLDMHPEAFPVAAYLAQHIRTPKKMAEGLRRWGQLALEQAHIAEENTRQGSLLGPRPTLTRAEIFARLGSDDNPAGQGVAPPPAQGAPEPVQAEMAQAQAQPVQIETAPAPSEVDRHPTWRKNAIQAGRVARDLGLQPKGKRLAQIVAEIDARDSESNKAVAPATQALAATETGANEGRHRAHGKSQTQTDAFKRWFGDSAVVDAEGNPLVMYHGTSSSQDGQAFTVFDTYASNYGLMGMGGYFTADPAVSSSYTSKGKGSTPTVYPVYLSIKNPLDMDAQASPAIWRKQFPEAEQYLEGGTKNENWYRAAEDSLSDQRLPKWEGAEIMQDGLRAMGFDGITHIGGGRVKADGISHSVYIAFDPEQIKSATGNNGDFDPANPDIRYAFAGQNAATADTMALATAQDRLDAGEDAEAVRRETGWHKGNDGKWRFEISDADAKLKDRAQWTAALDGVKAKRDTALRNKFAAEEARNAFLRARGESPSRISADTKKTPEFKELAKALKNAEAAADRAQDGAFSAERGGSLITVGDVLEHPALFAAYPGIAGVRVDINSSLPANNAAYAYELRAIELSGQSNPEEMLSTLLHEIQHGIQHIEGFAMGGAPSQFADRAADRSALSDGAILSRLTASQGSLEKAKAEFARRFKREPAAGAESAALSGESADSMQKRAAQMLEPHERYRRLAGETEARNTQTRQKMTDAQRRAAPPRQTADVADADVIVVFNGKEMRSAPVPVNAGGGAMSPELARVILALARPAPATTESVRKAVRELVNGLGLLPNSLGRIVVATSDEIKQEWEPLIGPTGMEASGDAGKAQGFYDPKSKTVFLIADNIKAGDELGVVAHELMHKHGPAVLGKEGWGQLHGAIGGWAKAKAGSMERIVHDEAARRVQASGPELSNQELFPYAVQVALEMGVRPNAMAPQGTVARWLAQVRSALRQVWDKIAGGKGDFNSLDLVNLAFGIAQRENPAYADQLDGALHQQGKTDSVDGNVQFSRATVEGVAARMGDAIKAVTVTNLKEQAGFKATDYMPLGLQLLGRRQLVDVYGKLLPQLSTYNGLMAQMDADKNEAGAGADELATAWAKLDEHPKFGIGPAKHPGMERKLAELMHDATLAQIDPAKDFVEGDNKTDWTRLRAQYQALSPAAREVYGKARDTYGTHMRQVRSAIKERIERSEMGSQRKAEMLKRMDDEFFGHIKGVYFPLARFGQYVVVVKDAEGKTASVSRAETMGEAQAARQQLQTPFPASKGFTVGKVLKAKEFIADRDAVGRGFMEQLYGVLDEQNMDGKQKAELEDALGQLYLSAMPDLSWAKHGIHRKGTPGFSQDARRAFAQNVFHGARYLAKLRYSDLLQDELNAMDKHVSARDSDAAYDSVRARQVVDEMNKRHDAAMNPQGNPLSTALTSAGFVFYLGLSPASAMVNLSQTALVAYPVMAAKWGYAKSAAALLSASKQAAVNRNDISGALNADEKAAYDEAVRAGVIDVTMAHDLAGIAQGEDSGVMWKVRPVMKWASFMFHHAEKFNRQVTFVAAYRLAREGGADATQAYVDAAKATYDGHFDYSSNNRPRVMQGNAARVLLLFKQYGQNMVYTLVRNAQQSLKGATPEERAQARKALGGLLTMHAMAAGALGLPMVTTLLAAASMLGGDDDEPWDAKVAMQNMLADAFGQKPAEVLAHGLSRLTPWDVSGRVGLDRLILPDIQEGLEGQRLGESAMAAALGPVAGIFVNLFKGVQEMGEGRYMRGLEAMMPTVLRSPLKALRYGTEGVRDKSGIVVQDEVDVAELLGQASGFSPSSVRNSFEGKSAIVQHDRALQARRSSLVEQFAMAAMAGDEDGKVDARESIARFNEKNPDRRILPMQLAQSVRMRTKRIEQAQDGVYLPTKRREALDVGRFATGE